jgi:hypothetical protein
MTANRERFFRKNVINKIKNKELTTIEEVQEELSNQSAVSRQKNKRRRTLATQPASPSTEEADEDLEEEDEDLEEHHAFSPSGERLSPSFMEGTHEDADADANRFSPADREFSPAILIEGTAADENTLLPTSPVDDSPLSPPIPMAGIEGDASTDASLEDAPPFTLLTPEEKIVPAAPSAFVPFVPPENPFLEQTMPPLLLAMPPALSPISRESNGSAVGTAPSFFSPVILSVAPHAVSDADAPPPPVPLQPWDTPFLDGINSLLRRGQ